MQIPLWQEADRREADWDDTLDRLPRCSCCAHPIAALPYLRYEGIRLCSECLSDCTVEFWED